MYRAQRWQEACAALEEAVRLADALGDEAYETLIVSLVLLEMALPELRRIDEAEHVATRAIALSRERGDQLHYIAALTNRRLVRIARHDVRGAIEDLQSLMRAGREIGMVLAEYFGEVILGELLYLADDLERADEHARRAIAIEDRHPEVGGRMPLAVLYLARIEAYRGNEDAARALLDRIEDTLRRARAQGDPSGGLMNSHHVLMAMVDLATRNATSQEWQELLERSARDSVEQEPIEVADLYGTWALRRGRIEEARQAFEEAARRAARIPNIMDERIRRGLEATAARTT